MNELQAAEYIKKVMVFCRTELKELNAMEKETVLKAAAQVLNQLVLAEGTKTMMEESLKNIIGGNKQ